MRLLFRNGMMFTCGPSLFNTATVPPITLLNYLKGLSPVALFTEGDSVGSSNLIDSISGITAALSGTYTLGSTGLVQGDPTKSILWNGSSAHANTVAGSMWSLGTGDFSAVWAQKWTSTSFGATLAVRDLTNPNILFLSTINRVVTGDVEVECWNWSSSKVSAGSGFNDGNVHTIYIYYTASSNTLGIYVDGVSKASAVQTSARPTGSSMWLTLGNNSNYTQSQPCNQGFVTLFNKNLTLSQITSISNLVKFGHT